MVDYSTLSIVFTGLSISLAAFYYINTLRNAQKTRQIQMFMQLYESKYDQEGLEALFTLMYLEWEDFDDYMEKYSPVTGDTKIAVMMESQVSYMDGLGLLVKNIEVDLETVYNVAGRRVLLLWFKLETLIKSFREPVWGMPEYAENFEYLAYEMIRIRRQKGLPIPYLVYLHPTSKLHQELKT